MPVELNTVTVDLSIARPPAQRIQIPHRALYAVQVDGPFTVRFGSPTAQAIPFRTAGRICHELGEIGDIYIENAAGTGVLVLVSSNNTDFDFFGSGAGESGAEYVYGHIVPTDTTGGSNPAALDEPLGDGSVAFMQGDGANGGTFANFFDAARGLASWRGHVPVGANPSPRAGLRLNVGAVRRNWPIASAFSDVAGVPRNLTRLGRFFLETDVHLRIVRGGGSDFMAAGVLWSGSLAPERWAGLVWADDGVSDNWRIIVAEQLSGAGFTNKVVDVDTGISALADAVRAIRLEGGADGAGQLMRAIIDGNIVAEFRGALALTANVAQAIQGGGMQVQVQQYNGIATNEEMDIRIGALGGFKHGWIAP